MVGKFSDVSEEQTKMNCCISAEKYGAMTWGNVLWLPIWVLNLKNQKSFTSLVIFPVFRLRGETDPHKLLDDPVVADIAKKHRRSPAQVSVIQWTVSVCVCVCVCVYSFVSDAGVLLGTAEVPCAAGYCSHP